MIVEQLVHAPSPQVQNEEEVLAEHPFYPRPSASLRATGPVTGKAKRSNIPHRRLAEIPATFAIELARALVADLKRCAGGIQTSINIRVRAACRRSCFWYWRGIIAVNDRR